MITFCGPFCNSSLPNYGVGDNLYLKRLKKMNSSFRYHFNCCLFRRGTFAAVSNTSMENYLNFCRLMDYNIHRGIFLSPIQKCITPPPFLFQMQLSSISRRCFTVSAFVAGWKYICWKMLNFSRCLTWKDYISCPTSLIKLYWVFFGHEKVVNRERERETETFRLRAERIGFNFRQD